ncbi:MAG: hypothetical protein Kow0059_06800 [Candidatus Sumerlaeia bacterium]
MIARDLLDILACPACHARVVQDGSAIQCTNGECRRRYPVRDDIPVMLVTESQVLDADDWQRRMKAGEV